MVPDLAAKSRLSAQQLDQLYDQLKLAMKDAFKGEEVDPKSGAVKTHFRRGLNQEEFARVLK